MRLLVLIILLSLTWCGSAAAQPYIATPLFSQTDCENIYAFGFTPSGDTIVMTGYGRGLALWPPGDPLGLYIRQPDGPSPSEQVSAAGPIAVSRNGTYVVTSTKHHLVWDMTSYRVRYYLTNVSPYSQAAFTLDGQKLLTMSPSGISVRNISTGILEKEIAALGTNKQDLDLSPDGAHIAYSNDSGSIWMLSFPDGAIEWEYKRGFPVYNLQFSPDGERILGYSLQRREGGGGHVEAFEINTTAGELVRTYPPYTQNVSK